MFFVFPFLLAERCEGNCVFFFSFLFFLLLYISLPCFFHWTFPRFPRLSKLYSIPCNLFSLKWLFLYSSVVCIDDNDDDDVYSFKVMYVCTYVCANGNSCCGFIGLPVVERKVFFSPPQTSAGGGYCTARVLTALVITATFLF